PRNDEKTLLPGEHRLFQFGDAGIAPLQHFAELIDQGRGRRVDEPAGVTKPDHAPCALGDGREVEGGSPCDIIKRDAVHGGDRSAHRPQPARARPPPASAPAPVRLQAAAQTPRSARRYFGGWHRQMARSSRLTTTPPRLMK